MEEAMSMPTSPSPSSTASAEMNLLATISPKGASKLPMSTLSDNPAVVAKPNTSSSTTSMVVPPRHYVNHSYTDYANIEEDDNMSLGSSGGSGGGNNGHLKQNGTMNFPGKLLEVLDRGDLSNTIDWMPHGRAFIVKDPKIFTSHVLPRFFRQNKFLSFTRQLNLWGFKRITRGLDAGAYYHECFLPGRSNLVLRMKRQKTKGTGIRPIPNPAEEPNFYHDYARVPKVVHKRPLSPLPPLPSERVASLMQENGGGNTKASMEFNGVAAMGGNVESSSMDANGMSTGGILGGLRGEAALAMSNKNLMTGAAAAEFRLLGIMKAAEQHPPAMSIYPQGSICHSALNNKRNRQEEDTKESLMGDMRTPKRQFLERATDDDCDANRRLMERLLDVPAASVIPEHLRAVTQESLHSMNTSSHSSTAPSLYSASSILSDMQQQGSLRQLLSHPVESAATARTISSAPYYGHGSMQQQFQSHHTSSAPAPLTRTPLFGLQEFGSYRPSTQGVSSSYLSSLPYQRALDINVQDVTNALRDAQQLEDLAFSQRARARALASALQHQTGYNGPR